eukprot:1030576-Rhodomonas_salina.2
MHLGKPNRRGQLRSSAESSGSSSSIVSALFCSVVFGSDIHCADSCWRRSPSFSDAGRSDAVPSLAGRQVNSTICQYHARCMVVTQRMVLQSSDRDASVQAGPLPCLATCLQCNVLDSQSVRWYQLRSELLDHAEYVQLIMPGQLFGYAMAVRCPVLTGGQAGEMSATRAKS